MAGESRIEALASARAELAGRKVLVALSGGPDSVFLAALAFQHASAARAVFVDHQWPDSGLMQTAAEKTAAEIGIPFSVIRVDVPEGNSPERQARIARYAALEAALADGEVLVTGHNSNDQAETILFNLVRGSGPRGVSGMPHRRGRLLRPLLGVDRSVIEAEVADLGLSAALDPANSSMDFARNRVRGVLPSLLAAVGVADHMPTVRSGALAKAEDELLDALAGRVPVRFESDAVSVSVSVLSVLPAPVRSRVLRRMMEQFRPFGAYFDETRRLEELLENGESIDLAGGLRGVSSATTLSIYRPAEPWSTLSWDDDEIDIASRWKLAQSRSEMPPAALPIGNGSAVFDADLVTEQLTLAPAAQHSTIATGVGAKSVRDCLSESIIPFHLRDAWPVVATGPTVLWIPGVRRAAVGFISASTRRYLSLHVVQEDKCKTRRF